VSTLQSQNWSWGGIAENRTFALTTSSARRSLRRSHSLVHEGVHLLPRTSVLLVASLSSMSGARSVHGEPSSCQISRLSELSSIGILIVETVTQTACVIRLFGLLFRSDSLLEVTVNFIAFDLVSQQSFLNL